MQPKDEDELQDMMATGIGSGLPSFVRYPRGAGTGVFRKEKPAVIPIGKAEVLREGKGCAIWALGNFVPVAEKIAEHLYSKHGLRVSVINARFVKPIDEQLLLSQLVTHDSIITLEDNVLKGGFGSAILETLDQNDILIPVKRFGWPDEFIEHGNSVSDLRKNHGLDDESIISDAEEFLKLDSGCGASLIA
jgi:1-deoxy-D-xylulose-5-phosphate synthase